MGVSHKIRIIRTYLQVSQAEFARLLKVSESFIQALEEGQQELSTPVLAALVKEVNLSADWLLLGVGEMFFSPSLRIKSSKGADIVLPQPEKYLDDQIKALEERLQKETHLPLKQIRVLFIKILNVPADAINASDIPDEFSPGNLQDLSYEEKTRYYQQLQYRMQEGQQEFVNHFQKLIQLVGQQKS